MLPARNHLRRQFYDCNYGKFFSNSYFDFQKPPPATLRSPEFMSAGLANGEERREVEEEEEDPAGTTSSSTEGWLQLGIGVGIRPPTSCRSPTSTSPAPTQIPLSTELELFAARSVTAPTHMNLMFTPPPVLPPPPPHLCVFYPRDSPWGFLNAGSLAMGGVMTPPAFPSAARGFMLPLEAASGELRVVRPPVVARPPAAGVWFLLKALQNQVREPFLPQIPKTYLRIKNGKMTVRLLKKYLVSKLGLEDESEVEISCRGQPLLPFLTVQYVRDNIWQLRETPASSTVPPESPFNEPLMILYYGRCTT